MQLLEYFSVNQFFFNLIIFSLFEPSSIGDFLYYIKYC